MLCPSDSLALVWLLDQSLSSHVCQGNSGPEPQIATRMVDESAANASDLRSDENENEAYDPYTQS